MIINVRINLAKNACGISKREFYSYEGKSQGYTLVYFWSASTYKLATLLGTNLL